MQIMISVISAEEAAQSAMGCADILDVKNPDEGSLGARSRRGCFKPSAVQPQAP